MLCRIKRGRRGKRAREKDRNTAINVADESQTSRVESDKNSQPSNKDDFLCKEENKKNRRCAQQLPYTDRGEGGGRGGDAGGEVK